MKPTVDFLKDSHLDKMEQLKWILLQFKDERGILHTMYEHFYKKSDIDDRVMAYLYGAIYNMTKKIHNILFF